MTAIKEGVLESEDKTIPMSGRDFYIHAIFGGNRMGYQEERLEKARKRFDFTYEVFNNYFHEGSEIDLERLNSLVGIVRELETDNNSYNIIDERVLDKTIRDFKSRIGECAARIIYDYDPDTHSLVKRGSFWSKDWELYKRDIPKENDDPRRDRQINSLETIIRDFGSTYEMLADHPKDPGKKLERLAKIIWTAAFSYTHNHYSSVESEVVMSVISDFERKLEEAAERFGWDYKMPVSGNAIFRNAFSCMHPQLNPDDKEKYNPDVPVSECLAKKNIFSRIGNFFSRHRNKH